MDNDTPWLLQVMTDLIIEGNNIWMYPSRVYLGGFSDKGRYGEDPTITTPGRCRTECKVTYLVAQAIKSDAHTFEVLMDEPDVVPI